MFRLLVLAIFLLNIPRRAIAEKPEDFSFTGKARLSYTMDTLNNKKDKVNRGEIITFGYFDFNLDYEFNLIWGFNLKNSISIRPTGRRIYNGGYGGYPNVASSSHARDDFYGKENYLNRDFYFGRYGLLVDEIALQHRSKYLLLGIGKANPYFGIAHDRERMHGLAGTAIAEEYKLEDKFDMYAAITFPAMQIRLDLFMDDRTHFSNSLFLRRGRDKSSGGAGNTGKPNSFSLSLDNTIGNWKTHLAFRRLAVSKSYEKAEVGYLFALEYSRPEDRKRVGFIPMVEAAMFHNFDGVAGHRMFFLTTSFPIYYKGWSFVASETLKFDFEKKYTDYSGSLTQFAVGYQFKFGLLLEAAQKFHVEHFKLPHRTGVKEKFIFNSWLVSVSYALAF